MYSVRMFHHLYTYAFRHYTLMQSCIYYIVLIFFMFQCPVCQTEGLLVIAKYVGTLLDTTTSDVIYVTAKGKERT